MKNFVLIAVTAFLVLPIGVLSGLVLSGQTYDNKKELISCEPAEAFDPNAFCALLLTYTHINYKETYLFITRGQNGSYGETIPYPQLTPDGASGLTTVWSEAGVEFTTGYGYKLFVSREKFSGGR